MFRSCGVRHHIRGKNVLAQDSKATHVEAEGLRSLPTNWVSHSSSIMEIELPKPQKNQQR